jgi:hypothetical protein
MRFLCGVALVGCCLFAARAAAAETATASVTVQVDVCSRKSLRVSSGRLRFTVLDDAAVAMATVEFEAAARVPPGAGLVLTVEALSELEGVGSVALGGLSSLDPFEPAVAARWQAAGPVRGDWSSRSAARIRAHTTSRSSSS